jgi:hypothetical protein
MIASALAAAVVIVLATVVAGGFLLRLAGRVAIVLGLGAAVRGDPLGLLIAVLGGLMSALGSSRPLDRRRRHA